MYVVTPTITVDTNAFTSGDSIGGKITLTNAMEVSGGSAILDQITLIDRANQKPVCEIFIFESDPSAATITNNAAFVFSTDDTLVIARIVLASGDWTTTNSKGVACVKNIGALVKAVGSKNLYAAIVTTSTPTFVATTDLKARFCFRRGVIKN